jgi:hypothetical protein
MDESSEEKKKRRQRDRKRQRYADEPEFREKEKAYSRAYRLKNADAVKTRERVRRYGLSPEEYAAMVARQGGVCVICLKTPQKTLGVDHDHETKKLRSLLCDNCNLGLGHYDDDSAAMRRAADYLDYWQWRHAAPNNTGPSPFVLAAPNRFLAPTQQTIQYLEPEGEVITPIKEPTDHNKASLMVRRAILHELLQPFEPDLPPPVDMLQAVARAIVIEASQGDMTAAKEVLDRIDGKTPPTAPELDQVPATRQVNVSWKSPI